MKSTIGKTCTALGALALALTMTASLARAQSAYPPASLLARAVVAVGPVYARLRKSTLGHYRRICGCESARKSLVPGGQFRRHNGTQH